MQVAKRFNRDIGLRHCGVDASLHGPYVAENGRFGAICVVGYTQLVQLFVLQQLGGADLQSFNARGGKGFGAKYEAGQCLRVGEVRARRVELPDGMFRGRYGG